MSLQNLINRLDTAEADFEARFTRLLHWSPEQDQNRIKGLPIGSPQYRWKTPGRRTS